MIPGRIDDLTFDERAIHDLLVFVPIGSEDVLAAQVGELGRSRILMDPEEPDEFLYDENDCATIRIGRGVDPREYARAITHRVFGLKLAGMFAWSNDREIEREIGDS